MTQHPIVAEDIDAAAAALGEDADHLAGRTVLIQREWSNMRA